MTLLIRAATVLLALLAWSPGARAMAAAGLLPCPLAAGWRLERQLELPRRTADGREIGGFSAIQRDPATNELLLLSDATEGALLRWSGLPARGTPRLLEVLPLQRPMDGKALVVRDGQLWVASEGRRTPERQAQLLRFDAGSGELLEALPMPPAWQPGAGTGLARNGGPESLLLLPPPAGGGAPALLMAAEYPLLQDPPDAVRLLRWQWPAGADPRTATPTVVPQGALRLPGEGWGLTELMLVEPGRLLALLRRFEAPFSWRIRLALYPLPAPSADASTAEAAVRPEDTDIDPRSGDLPRPARGGELALRLGDAPAGWAAAGRRHGLQLADGGHRRHALAGGMGFAMPDNLAIDRAGNVWMVTDRSGGSFEQLRQVPLGSSWPSPVPGRPLL